MLNTVARGNSFEEHIYNYMKGLMEEGSIPWANPKFSEIFKKKCYFSKDRDSNIEVDVSIEVYPQIGRKDISLLSPIECKDHKSSIPVRYIEEFSGKVQQISGLNCKAIFFSTSEFQKSAVNFAKSKKIALVRVLPNNETNWVNFHGTPEMIENELRKIETSPLIRELFLRDDVNLQFADSISYYNDKYYIDFKRFISELE